MKTKFQELYVNYIGLAIVNWSVSRLSIFIFFGNIQNVKWWSQESVAAGYTIGKSVGLFYIHYLGEWFVMILVRIVYMM